MGICGSTKNESNNKLDGIYKKSNTLNRNKTIYQPRKPVIHNNPGTTLQNEKFKHSAELFVSIINNEQADNQYQVKLSICNDKNTGYKQDCLTTEYMSGELIRYESTCIVDYFFEKEQILYLSIFDFNGEAVVEDTFTMGRVMGSRRNTLNIKYDNFSFEITAKNASGFDISVTFSVKMHLEEAFTSSMKVNPPYYFIVKNFNDGLSYRNAYSSEDKFDRISSFDSITLEGNIVNNGNESQLIQFEFCNNSGPFAYIQRSLHDLLREGTIQLMNFHSSPIPNCFVNIKATSKKIFKFIDLLKLGVQINLGIGVDYTSSNGPPDSKTSLHCITNSEPNHYERAIRSCGSIVAYYDYDQKFPLYGFGGQKYGDRQANHCFAVNNNEDDPEIQGIEQVVKQYKESLNYIILSGPTYFSPLIRKINQSMRELVNSGKYLNYMILMIITDGIISDMDSTIDEIFIAAKLPISIIIIGLGNADFTNMEELDGDDIPLMNNKNEKVPRDIVQFVPFNKYEGNFTKLSEEVLAEIPTQIEEYYRNYDFRNEQLTESTKQMV